MDVLGQHQWIQIWSDVIKYCLSSGSIAFAGWSNTKARDICQRCVARQNAIRDEDAEHKRVWRALISFHLDKSGRTAGGERWNQRQWILLEAQTLAQQMIKEDKGCEPKVVWREDAKALIWAGGCWSRRSSVAVRDSDTSSSFPSSAEINSLSTLYLSVGFYTWLQEKKEILSAYSRTCPSWHQSINISSRLNGVSGEFCPERFVLTGFTWLVSSVNKSKEGAGRMSGGSNMFAVLFNIH